MTTKCTFCHRAAFAAGVIRPDMCEKHHALAIVLRLIENRGAEPTLDNVRLIVAWHPKTGLSLDEVDDLYASMFAIENT